MYSQRICVLHRALRPPCFRISGDPCKTPGSCNGSLNQEPFKVLENGLEIPVRHVTQIRGAREFMISLEDDMVMGSSYMITKPGFRIGAVAYGILYDTQEFEDKFTYTGDDLGASWTPEETRFRVWTPIASSVYVNIFQKGSGPNLETVVEMVRDQKGTWVARVPGDLSGKYYTYTVIVMGMTLEAADPYARSSGINGRRSMIIDLDRTNPPDWEKTGYIELRNPTDAVLYEVHVRDATIHESSGIRMRGKFAGLAEAGTKSPQGNSQAFHISGSSELPISTSCPSLISLQLMRPSWTNHSTTGDMTRSTTMCPTVPIPPTRRMASYG